MEKTGNNKKIVFISTILLIVMSLILIYAGHFLFGSRSRGNGKLPEGSGSSGTGGQFTNGTPGMPRAENAVKYSHRSITLNGHKQEINMLEIDPSVPGIKIMPVLSFDLVYGFEKLSAMAERKKAYAAVNGGFFHVFGQPSGMVVVNGELFTASTGKYPVFIVDGGTASLKEIESKLEIEYGRGAESGTDSSDSADAHKTLLAGSFDIDNLNIEAKGRQTVVYTPSFGKSNRARQRNITATVVNGAVTGIGDYPGETEIPENGMLISFFDTRRYAGKEIPVREGDSVKLVHDPELGSQAQAYECGSWLVRDGVSVVKEKDAWVGIMTNRDPRTAVGIKADGTVILLTVDGRQPGYSAGFTGQELAEYLIDCGAKDAAMLDGGASTEMLLKGKLVNKPSYGGEERELAGGILVLLGD